VCPLRGRALDDAVGQRHALAVDPIYPNEAQDRTLDRDRRVTIDKRANRVCDGSRAATPIDDEARIDFELHRPYNSPIRIVFRSNLFDDYIEKPYKVPEHVSGRENQRGVLKTRGHRVDGFPGPVTRANTPKKRALRWMLTDLPIGRHSSACSDALRFGPLWAA
jgi:hypothetical protein